jgi:hypothetical protein
MEINNTQTTQALDALLAQADATLDDLPTLNDNSLYLQDEDEATIRRRRLLTYWEDYL